MILGLALTAPFGFDIVTKMFDSLFLIQKEIAKYWTTFLRLIYPSFCIFCEKPLSLDENYCCEPCVKALPMLRTPLCPKCASELPPFLARKSRCSSCRNITAYYDQGIAFFRYEDKIKTLLQHVKFSKKSWYLKIFLKFLSEIKFPISLGDYDMLVPVPMDSKRLREREFNQSELIAELIGRTKNAPPVESLLKKVRKTAPQSLLHRNERLVNLTEAFQVKKRFNLKNKKILLIDDVMTTGATINECARSLKEKGAKRVDFFSLARTIFSAN